MISTSSLPIATIRSRMSASVRSIPISSRMRERLEFQKVADNDWLNEFRPPSSIAIDCLPHEEISYMMRNTRGANADRNKRGLPSHQSVRILHRYDPGPWTIPMASSSISGLDIVGNHPLPQSRGMPNRRARAASFPITDRKGRTPSREELSCEEGSYLFVGIEDRPPEWAWSDRDYDDLRFVISCPSGEEIRSTVRLVG